MNQHEFLKILIRENLERQLLYEGLMFTCSLYFLYPSLVKLGFSKKRDFEFNPMNNILLIKFALNEKNKERYKQINELMDNVGGWFHGASIAGTILKDKLDFLSQQSGQVILQYEPKHDIEISAPEVLYHLTKSDKVNKIKKVGLTPRSSETFFNYKDRIYFSLDKESLKKLAEQKKQINLMNKINSGESKFAILTIKPNGASNRIRFFKDPNFFNGIYTKENIHPFSIKDIEYFEIKH